MSDFYTAIKTHFDADVTLVASGEFSELLMAEADPSEDKPFAVLSPGDEVQLGGSFASKYYRHEFSITVVHSTQELVRAAADLVEAAFDDCESSLSMTGRNVIRIEQSPRRYAIDPDYPDVWMCVLTFTVEYSEDR